VPGMTHEGQPRTRSFIAPERHSPISRSPSVTIAVIPARFASTRFPGKLLEPLHGRSVLGHVLERAQLVRGLDRVLVATDDARIEAEARRFGCEAVLTSAAHLSGTDRIGEVLRGLRPAPEFVLNLQGDEPVLAPRAVERLLAAVRGQPDAIWTLADRIGSEDEFRRPSVVKVVCDREGRALYFSRAPIPYDRAGAGLFGLLRHVGVYAFPRRCLESFLAAPVGDLERTEGLEQLRALESGIAVRVLRASWPDAAVDTPEDLERLRRRYPTLEDLAAAGMDGAAD
jgi:3-deoxy-D-manno-octulosonate cytidylyltransferase